MKKWIGYVLGLALAAGAASGPHVEARFPPDVIDGVSRFSGLSSSSAASAIRIGFDAPKEFMFTLPLQVYMNFHTRAYFWSGPRAPGGNGAVLDVSSFNVTGYSPPYALAWNSIEGMNADGTVPSLPQFIIFFKLLQSVSIRVGSFTSQGEMATLTAFTGRGNVLGLDAVVLTPEMQTLSVTVATPGIRYVVLSGPAVLVADDLIYQ